MIQCSCKEEFNICGSESTIHLISNIDELLKKSDIYINELGLETNIDENICSFVSLSPNLFFEENADFLIEKFSEEEQKEIRVFIENHRHPLTINSVLKSKPLFLYLNFIKDASFFDILYSKSFTSHFQAIIDMKKNSIFGYEALIRGVYPDGTLMYPDEIFKKSTRNNTNFKLDQICRETALKTAATKRVNKKIFINFLPTSIYDPEFCLQSTVKWAKQLDYDPKNIIFEVVETEKVEDKSHLKNILNFYREKGFLIALDDVGEGYSSLNMIVDIKPDIIKVDRNIIDNIQNDTMKQSIYKALRQISDENGIKLLAEGVETIEELNKVKEIGVDYVQGYYYAKPSAEIIRKIAY
jgi:EAL domain-containing protein (putative c-di-GMP-specific phosphodiesterase class I)